MNMKSPRLADIDETTLPEFFDVPEAFKESVYTPAELMQLLRFDAAHEDDVGQFWLAVRAGRIPRGVFLPTTKPLCVWDRDIIDTWIRLGCPPDPIHLAHEQIIFRRLVAAVEETLSPTLPTVIERN